MAIYISASAEQTEQLGLAWGQVAQRGWVLGLQGDLGAGKTCLAKGIARGLKIEEPILSPSFALINEYRSGRLPLFHLDLYRLETVEQIVAAGLEEYFFRPPGVAVIEWMERWATHPEQWLKPGQGEPILYRHVTLEQISEHERRIHYEDFSP